MNYRNRKLLDLAYEIPCQIRLLGVCEGGPGEPCHSNQAAHGKGGSIKAHDCFFASGCRPCHRELDQGRTMSREEKFALWQEAYNRTMLALWRGEFLMVRGDDRNHDTVSTTAAGPASTDALRPKDA